MSVATRAAILWIILIQSREFAKGKGFVTAEFKEIQHCPAVKRADIMHSELPSRLTAPLEAVKRKPGLMLADGSELGKKLKGGANPPTAINPILKPLADTWYATNMPRLKEICSYCKVGLEALSKDGSTRRSNLLFGPCSYKDACILKHRTAINKEAKSITDLLGKFIEAPDGLAKSRKEFQLK